MHLFHLEFAETALEDLERLYAFYMRIDPAVAEYAQATIESAFQTLRRHPTICRKAQQGDLGPAWRELIINFGNSGYVALFEMVGADTIYVVAVRHQRESDYH